MADTKTTALNNLPGASIATNDAIPIADVSASETKYSTIADLAAATQTLTNKTITGNIATNFIDGSGHTITLPAATDTLVGKATTDTLTNKTLTAPVIASMVSGSGTVTVPAATGTLPIIIASSGTASSTTNSATEVNLAVVTIPAGIMGTNGSLVIQVGYKYVGTAGTKTPIVRHSTSSGDTSAGTIIGGNNTVANTVLSQSSTPLIVRNSNSASAQIFPVTSAASGLQLAGSSPTALSTGAINTANASYININALTANSGDTAQVVWYTVLFYPGV